MIKKIKCEDFLNFFLDNWYFSETKASPHQFHFFFLVKIFIEHDKTRWKKEHRNVENITTKKKAIVYDP